MLIYIAYFIFFVILAVEYELKPFKNNFFLIIVILSLGLLAGVRGRRYQKIMKTINILSIIFMIWLE